MFVGLHSSNDLYEKGRRARGGKNYMGPQRRKDGHDSMKDVPFSMADLRRALTYKQGYSSRKR